LAAKIAALLLLLVTAAGPAVAAFARPNAIPDIPDNPYGVNVFLNKEAEPWKV